MGRLVLALLLAVFLVQTLVVAPVLAAAEPSPAACSDEGGACAPACVDCGCCSHVSRTLLPPHGEAQPVAGVSCSPVVVSETRLPPAFAADVFHVPKLHRA